MLGYLLIVYYWMYVSILLRVLQCGWTPLHKAALYGHGDIVDALITAGAKVDATSDVSCSSNKV